MKGIYMKYKVQCLLAVVVMAACPVFASPPNADQLSQFFSISGMSAMGQSEKDIFSQNLSAEDISGYLSFMGSDKGKRYVAFDAKVSELSRNSMRDVMGGKVSAQTPLTLPKEQAINYQRLLLQSSTFQTMQLHQEQDKTDDGVVANIMMQVLLKKYPDQLGELYKEYGGDIDDFAAFNKSQVSHNLQVAVSKAMQQIMKQRMAAH